MDIELSKVSTVGKGFITYAADADGQVDGCELVAPLEGGFLDCSHLAGQLYSIHNVASAESLLTYVVDACGQVNLPQRHASFECSGAKALQFLRQAQRVETFTSVECVV